MQDGDYAKRLNTSLAFFIHDAFALMDRGIVFILIKTYLKKVSKWAVSLATCPHAYPCSSHCL